MTPTTILSGTATRKVKLTTCIQICPKCGLKQRVVKRYSKPRKEALVKFRAELAKLGWTQKGKDWLCPKHGGG
jgi:hypothetical protein